MTKRRPAFSADQLAFSFDLPSPDRGDGALAGFSRMVSSAVARILHEDGRTRRELAFEMSRLLDEEIDKTTVDGWASESRDRFNISFARAYALFAATDRIDVLDALGRHALGVATIEGDEILTAELGHIDRQMAKLRDRKKKIQNRAPLIGAARSGES